MNIRDTIKSIMADPVKFSRIRFAKVVSVQSSTCTVIILDSDTIVDGVLLQTEISDGILITPAVDSIVAIAPYADFEYIVVMFSKIDEIKFLDGSFGGLTKTQELKTQLDKTNEVVQAIVNALQNWTPVGGDGGAALKTFFAGQLGVKVVGDFSGIENEKITHGTV